MNLLTDGIKSKAVMLTQGTKKLSIDNHTQVYPVYKIRLDQLYFNDQNDRIATWISQYRLNQSYRQYLAEERHPCRMHLWSNQHG